MRPGLNSVLLIVFLLLLDLYVFQAVRAMVYMSAPRVRNITYYTYWSISAITVSMIALLPYINWQNWPVTLKSYLIAIFMGLVVAKLLVTVFLLIDDLRRGVLWLVRKLSGGPVADTSTVVSGLSRSQFINRLGLITGGAFLAP